MELYTEASTLHTCSTDTDIQTGILQNVTSGSNQTLEYYFEESLEHDNETDETIEIIADVILNGIYSFGAVSIVVNVLNIYVIVSSKLYHKLSYVLIVNLSVCDTLVPLSFLIYLLVPGSTEDMWITMFMDYLFTSLSLATLLTVLTMTFELLFMIKYPLKHMRYMKADRRFKIIVLTFVWSIAIVPPLLLDLVIPLLNTERDVNISYIEEVYYDVYEPYLFSVIIAILGLFLIVIFYSIIILEIYKRHKMKDMGIRKMRKSAITVCLIILTYFLLYLPFFISIGVYYLDIVISEFFDQLFAMTFLFQIINTLCDPLIYAFRIKTIRKATKKKLCKHLNCCPNFRLGYSTNTEATT